ncbi:MAG: O-antigen ligase family protein [Hyphomicrobiales bacterium]
MPTTELGLIVAAQCALLAAVVVLREPKLLIPCVVLGLPFEWAETQALDRLGASGASGAIRSLMNPGQAAMAATVVVAAFRARHTPWKLIPNSSVLLPLLLMFTLLFVGVGWSDNPTRPNNSVLILPLYLGFILAAPSLIEDRRDIERIVAAFLAAAAVLAAIAIAQRLLGVFNWRAVLLQSDDYSYRSNATFSDPNILARFLAISMALAAGMVLTTGPRRTTVYLAVPALVFGAAGIVATASRSGWIMLLLCGFLMVMASPISRYTKARLTISAFGGLGIGLVLLLMQGGTDAERVKSLTQGVSVIGQREFLIRAGWEMWKDNPLIGVGSGNYQHSLLVSYLWVVPSWARTSLSHTSLVSILAELGIVGIITFAFVSFRVFLAVIRTYYATKAPYNRLVTAWIGISLLGIVLHSQSEGRLLDEPFLWVMLALLMAMETSPALAGKVGAPRWLFEPAQEPAPRPRAAAEAGGAMPVPAGQFATSD